ncbi:hypothetical protein TRIUR3_00518 [Triticum urartu]|uniref:Uncharacterized protein n=1 Tax=Triticum urartu TaxID=4572 RepID=M7ZXT7_TRIUA|nr:hypothetical protein TRIUR3_00518 [Triticum urartu]
MKHPLAAKTGGRTRHASVDEEELRRRRSTDCIYYLALPVDLQEGTPASLSLFAS